MSAPSTTFGKYRLVSRLAQGGMAETWRAVMTGSAGVEKPVVIKKVLPGLAEDPQFVEAFVHEARLVARLNHGNIVQVFDFGECEGAYFLAMELVEGPSLKQLQKRAAELGFWHLPIPVAVQIAAEICRGLHHAHTCVGADGQPLGVVHRDISPDNVMVSYDGETKVLDFGVAKARQLGRAETDSGVVKGKYLYFSPEQAAAEPLDARSDVFAVGVVLYRMLCGRLPFDGPMHKVVLEIIDGRFPPAVSLNPTLPDPLTSILARAMALKREDRFPSAGALEQELSGFLHRLEPDFTVSQVKTFVRHVLPPPGELEGPPLTQTLMKWKPVAAPGVTDRTAETKASRPSAIARRGRGRWAAALVGLGVLAAGVTAFVLRPIEAVKLGKLIVHVEPFGDISVDGQVLRAGSSIAEADLGEGNHALTVSNPELKKTLTRSIVVRPNATSEVSVNLLTDLR